MLKRVKVEDGDEKDCMVCLEELKVGADTSQMLRCPTFTVIASKSG